MPAFIAGIHVLLSFCGNKDVDARHKAGHDAERIVLALFLVWGVYFPDQCTKLFSIIRNRMLSP